MTAAPKPWLLDLGKPETPDAAPREGGPKPSPDALPPDTLGLALSGGGIRSAAFCLGVIQALARARWLRCVDYLSTVSGGGYVGAFLGRFFDQCARRDGLTGAIPDPAPGAGQDRVARDLVDSRSEPIAWLRRHSNYLSPTGQGEMATNVAGFWRNLLSIYLVLAAFLLTVFGLLNALAYLYPEGAYPGLAGDALAAVTPLTDTLMGRAGPWAVLAELTLWLAVVPLMLAYWMVSQDLPEAFLPPVLAALALLAGAVLVAAQSPLGLAVMAAAVVWALLVWRFVRRGEAHNDPFDPSRLSLARNFLTRWLASWLVVALGLAAFAVVDGLGRWLAWRMLQDGLTIANVTGWLASVVGIVLALATGLRVTIRLLVGESRSGGGVFAFSRPYLVFVLVLLVGVLPPLVALAFASHAAYELGDSYNRGLALTGVALVVSLLLGVKACVPFINRSGPLGIYTNRLARAFLGAVNPARRTHPEGRNVTHVVPGDDVPLSDYKPQEGGGPLHLINIAVNESIDVASQRGLRDRQAENMAVGPAGVTVAQRWHALWEVGPDGRLLAPLADADEASPHPFLAKSSERPSPEALSLQQWIAISGAALGPGMGRRTGLARALLLTLANVRLGYWWDSGLDSADRANVRGSRRTWRRLRSLFTTLFHAQSLLLAELIGRFAGPWERYWHLSDGGHFENTGAYELLRRRVPFVILCDAGEDARHLGSDLARLVRIARIDLGAEVTDVTGIPRGVPKEVAKRLASAAALLSPVGQPAPAHAALLLVRYPPAPAGGDGDPWLARTHTWVLYIKATLTGDEPGDVRNYAAVHPDFPNETTLDQVFDEPQWESYRMLGEHIGRDLFADSEGTT